MPQLSATIATGDTPLFFKKLSDLDDWNKRPNTQKRLDDVLKYTSRSTDTAQPSAAGRLLVCHDFKGGYTEYTSPLSYTFNFWDYCDTFIYFSHQRVTIPPPSWINAAHRQGVKMLGVLIFEHAECAEDLLRLLLGNIPTSKTAAVTSGVNRMLPVSDYYARALAQLASERGFDGYLLNFEYPLQGGPEQVRALEAWVSLLNHEMKLVVGPHAQTMWYDSVIIDGSVRWQDRLNTLNLNFFLPSTSFFTNYTWHSTFPSLSAQYLMSIDTSLLQGSTNSLQDIFVGIDVWGRGSHGGGGFGCYKALEHIDSKSMGLSAAVFGPGWTWESEQDKEGWNWEQWWAYERKLWIGPESMGERVEVPPMTMKPREPPCIHGDYKPLTSFFTSQTPPNPYQLAFYTSFSPGVGWKWYVGGQVVMQKGEGWTDIDKQTSLGNLLWPRPSIAWDTIPLEERLPDASTALTFQGAYNGGSSVVVSLRGAGTDAEESAFRCIWLPIQTLSVSHELPYTASLYYQASCTPGSMEVLLSAKYEDGEGEIEFSSDEVADELPHGWSCTTIQFTPKGTSVPSEPDKMLVIGVILSLTTEDASMPYGISMKLGQLSVHPTPSTTTVPFESRILWADCNLLPSASGTKEKVLAVTWDTAAYFTRTATINPLNIEDPNPPWVLDRSPHWYPRFQYFNIYALSRTQTPNSPSGSVLRPEDAQFIGTSGILGVKNTFYADLNALPSHLRTGPLRVYVQGVTDAGSVLPWDRCVYVDWQ